MPLPPVAEQQRIVAKVEALLARVDTARQRLAKALSILKRFRQSVLAAACSGRLTAAWRVEHPEADDAATIVGKLEGAHAAAGGHKAGNAAAPTDEAHDLSEDSLPQSWCMTDLRTAVVPDRPITYGILKPGPDTPGGIPYVRVADFPNNRLNLWCSWPIPAELRRIVEFLNGQMDPAEVLAIEIKQFVGQGLKTLVPRVIGQTVEAERKKGSSGAVENQWDEASFLETLTQGHGPQDAEVARTILSWAKKNALRIWWGRGAKDGSFYPMLDWEGNKNSVISVWTYGRLEVQFQWMKERPPFDAEPKREELRQRLNRIPGVDISADAITLRPRILLSALANKAAITQFLEVLDWFLQEVKAA